MNPHGFVLSGRGPFRIMFSRPGTNTSDNHSLTSDGSDSASFHSTSFVLCLLLLIPIFAIVGNLVIVAAVVRFQSLQTPTNAFVVSLAVADLLVAVLVMPFSLARSVDGWRFGQCFCRAHFLLDVTFCTCSIFNLSCVALDRYVAVCDPLHYPARMSPRRVAVLLLLCWLLPLVISSLSVSFGMHPQAPAAEVSGSTPDTQTCSATFQVPSAIASSAICFFIPMGFMLFAYGKIFKAAQRQARWIHATGHQTGQLHQNRVRTDPTRLVQAHMERYSLRKERKAAKTLGLIIGVFLLCWLPYFCVNMIHPLKGYSVSPLVLEACMWLGYANSSLNPFLYTLFNKNYRQGFAAMLDCGIWLRQFRAGLDSSLFGRREDTVVTLETFSR